MGAAVRALGSVDAPGGTRTPDGRWLARIDAAALEAELGTAALGIHRASLHRILREALPAGDLVAGSAVTAVPADADLVVGADGIDSTIRGLLWPGTAAVYAGSTAWRGVTDGPWTGALSVAIIGGGAPSSGWCRSVTAGSTGSPR